jgi:hypothetical protein
MKCPVPTVKAEIDAAPRGAMQPDGVGLQLLETEIKI